MSQITGETAEKRDEAGGGRHSGNAGIGDRFREQKPDHGETGDKVRAVETANAAAVRGPGTAPIAESDSNDDRIRPIIPLLGFGSEESGRFLFIALYLLSGFFVYVMPFTI